MTRQHAHTGCSRGSVAKPDPFGSASRTSPSPRTVCSVTRARRRSIDVHVPDRAIRLYRGPACGHARNSNCSSAIETMSAARPSRREGDVTEGGLGRGTHRHSLGCLSSKRKLYRWTINSSLLLLLVSVNRPVSGSVVSLGKEAASVSQLGSSSVATNTHLYIYVYIHVCAHTH